LDAASTLVLSPAPESPKVAPTQQILSTPSIAVLPFANMSADPQNQYFCDGLAQELINALTNINGLKVAARSSSFSFKGRDVDVREMGRKLDVSNVLEGSVRKEADRLRVTAQLISIADGYHLWSERYDRQMDDVFEIQDEISLAIVGALKLKLLGTEKAALLKRYTNSKDAYHLYLKGRYYLSKWTAEGIRKSINHFDQAIAIDPNYALPYAGLSDAYVSLEAGDALSLPATETGPRAKAAAIKALELDDSLAEAHAALGLVKLNFEWDWPGAESEFKSALALDPNYIYALHGYSHYLIAMGRTDESLEVSKRLLELGPLDLELSVHLIWHYYFARDYERAIEQALSTLEMDSKWFEAYYFLGWAYAQNQNYDQAIAAYNAGMSLEERWESLNAWLAHAYAASGNTVEARQLLKKLTEKSTREYVSPYIIAVVYVGLSEIDQALEWLFKAYEERNAWLPYLRVNPVFDTLRLDSRFDDLLRRVGLVS
jgi:adenylate cyclase